MHLKVSEALKDLISDFIFDTFHDLKIYEPAHEIMILITYATSEGSGEPAHPRSLVRTFAVRTDDGWK